MSRPSGLACFFRALSKLLCYTRRRHFAPNPVRLFFAANRLRAKRRSLFLHTRYDDRGRLSAVKTDVDGDATFDQQINYVYHPVTGQETRVWTGTDSGSPITDTRYVYDSLGRLQDVEAHYRFGSQLDADAGTAGCQPEVTHYIYDLGGNLRRTLSSAGISDYLYDSLNRLEILTHYRPDEWVYDDSDLTILTDNLAIARYEYTVRADGKRTSVTETLGYDLDGDFQPDVTETIDIDWFYDNLGRLIEEDYNSSNNALDFTADYVFDLVGNRLTKTVDQGRDAVVDEVITCEYDLNDRLLTESLDSDVPQVNGVDQTTTYGYDQTQQTSKTVWQGTDTDPQTGTKLSETTYTYNQQGRMASADVDLDADGHVDNRSEYEYNDSGIRVAQLEQVDANDDGDLEDQDDKNARTDYHVDHRNPTGYAQVLEEMNGATGQVVKSYTFGLDCIEEAVAAGVYRHLTDGHGSTRALVDALGVTITSGTVQVFAYDAYGNPIGFTPADALTTHLYSGEQTDQLTGLQYLRARYYNPATGTFNRLDPFAGNFRDPQSLHKHLYCHGDAVNGWDPRGMAEFTLAGMMTSMFSSANLRRLNWGAQYAAKQSAFAAVETSVEALILKLLNVSIFKNDPVPFELVRTFGTNLAVNLATGGLHKAILLKNALEITIRTISDVAFGENLYVSLGTNLVSAALTESLSIAGQRLINRWFRSAGLWDVLDGVDLDNLTKQQVGDLGEEITETLVRRNGFRDVIAVQNASNQGVDLVGRTADGRIVFFEVKSSRVGKVKNLEARQQDMMAFVSEILGDASQGTGRYANISDEMRDAAVRLFRDLNNDPMSVSGAAIGVDLQNQILRVSPWR